MLLRLFAVFFFLPYYHLSVFNSLFHWLSNLGVEQKNSLLKFTQVRLCELQGFTVADVWMFGFSLIWTKHQHSNMLGNQNLQQGDSITPIRAKTCLWTEPVPDQVRPHRLSGCALTPVIGSWLADVKTWIPDFLSEGWCCRCWRVLSSMWSRDTVCLLLTFNPKGSSAHTPLTFFFFSGFNGNALMCQRRRDSETGSVKPVNHLHWSADVHLHQQGADNLDRGSCDQQGTAKAPVSTASSY